MRHKFFKLLVLVSWCVLVTSMARAGNSYGVPSGDGSIEKIAERFAILSKGGGLIDQPKLPEEFYHNARIYNMRGDVVNAEKSYHTFIDFGLEVVDAHESYEQLLVLSEGKEFARKFYAALSAKTKNKAAKLQYLLLLGSKEKISGLVDFANSTSFAPAYYELSREYSVERLGEQGWTDKCNEKRILETFLRLVDEGDYYRYFLDKSSALKNVEDAKARLLKLKKLSCDTEPVSCKQRVLFPLGVPTIELSCHFVEIPQNLQLSKNVISKISGSGTISFDHRERFFRFTDLSEKLDMNVAYSDHNGNKVGPIRVTLDPETALLNAVRHEYERSGDLSRIENMLDGYEMYNVWNSIINREEIKKLLNH